MIDQADRDQAIFPYGSYIVQAPAGSGKTGLLVRRMLVLLSVVDKPEEILAITFTRKATAVMRKRLIGALQLAEKKASFEEHEQDMEALALNVLKRNEEKQWGLLQQPHRLKIQTIDSFCAELVRKMPWSARFGSMPQIETDLDTLYKQAATRLLQRINEQNLKPALTTLLIHNGGDMQGLQRRLAAMLYKRDEWVPLIVIERALANRSDLEQWWQNIYVHTIEQLKRACGPALSAALLELARFAEQNKPIGKQVLTENQLAALYNDSINTGLNSELIQWRQIEKLACKADGSFRSTVNKNDGFPAKTPQKDRVTQILNGFKEDGTLIALFVQLRQLPEPGLSDLEWDKLQALQEVLPALAQELFLMMAERGVTDYDELTRQAIAALGVDERPTDLALIQDYRLKHILMDEFQDTSPAQLELLKRLTAGWSTADTDRSLFLVGDPMQSIYGFRKADVRVFLQVRDSGINDIKLTPLNLQVNFRSSPVIIDWANATMGMVFPNRDELELAKVKYSPSVAARSFPGALHYALCVPDASQTSQHYRYCEANHASKQIQQILTRSPGESIAVLARKRAPLAALARVLRTEGVDFESVDLETLADQSIVQDLVCLCGILIQPLDDLAWLAVLRAPWYGLTLTDLTVLRKNSQPVIDSIRAEQFPLGLSDQARAAIQDIRSKLLGLIEAGTRKTLYERLRRAWLSLRGPACYPAHDLEHIESFFNMLHSLETSNQAISRTTLLETCEKHASSSPSNKLQLMTIHKAKGLEFDHVVLLGLASKSGGDHRQQPLLFNTQQGENLLIAPDSSPQEGQNSKAAYIRRYRQTFEKQEAVRLLYVALTRAVKHLYLYATLKSNRNTGLPGAPQQGSLLHLLWPEIQNQFLIPENQVQTASPNSGSDDSSVEPTSVPLLSLSSMRPALKLPTAIGIFEQGESAIIEHIEFDWAKEDARIIGLVVHRLLEFADQARLDNWQNGIDSDHIKACFTRFGLDSKRLASATQRVERILGRMAHDSRAKWLFSAEHRDIQSEWQLSRTYDGVIENHIIDRSFIDTRGVRWIIDFKTSRHEGGNLKQFLDEEEHRYAEQLNRYAELARTLEPERDVCLGLYFPALGEWRERKYTDQCD